LHRQAHPHPSGGARLEAHKTPCPDATDHPPPPAFSGSRLHQQLIGPHDACAPPYQTQDRGKAADALTEKAEKAVYAQAPPVMLSFSESLAGLFNHPRLLDATLAS
jgi:hypothetical protein